MQLKQSKKLKKNQSSTEFKKFNTAKSSGFIHEKAAELISNKSLKSKLEKNDHDVEIAKQEMKKKKSVKTHQHGKKDTFLFYPEDSFKNNWDVVISLVLIFICIVMPVRIAFVEEDSIVWKIILLIFDTLFTVDIFITFNSAFYDSDYHLIHKRKQIASHYIRTWFLIDVFAVIPFDLMMQGEPQYNDMARLARMSRMYKLVKLARLLRILKILK